MAESGYEYAPVPGGRAPAYRMLIEKQEFRLDYWTLPAATFKSDGLPVHHLAVQASHGAYLEQRSEGLDFNGWMPARSSWIAPAGSSSSSTWSKHHEVHVLSFAPSHLDEVLRDEHGGKSIELAPRVIGPDPFIAEVVHLMARCAGDGERYDSLLLDGLKVSLFAYLARHNAKHAAPKLKGGLAQWQLKRVLDLVEDRLGEEISLGALAAEVGLSERYFCTAFKHTFGVSPYRYVLERRIATAKSLLQAKPALRITEIAMAVGFQTSTHFASAFRHLTGLSPSSFRSQTVATVRTLDGLISTTRQRSQ